MAQVVERRLGKAEVGGSNPLGSSMETLEFSRVFCCFKGEKNRPGRAEFLERLSTQFVKPGDIPLKSCMLSGKKNAGGGAGLRKRFYWFQKIKIGL